MKIILLITRRISFSAFVLCVCLCSVQTVFSQAVTKTWIGTSGTDWSVAGNWTPSGVPATGDVVDVTGSNVAITSAAICQKLIITNATVTVSAALEVTNSGNTNVTASLVLNGSATVENNGGAITVTGRRTVDAIRFTGATNNTYSGSGALTCITTDDSGSGNGDGNNGNSITFAQTGGKATFTLGGSAYTFNTHTNGAKSVFYCPQGNAEIIAPMGGAALTISGTKRSIRVISTSGTASLTVESGVTMTMSSDATATGIGMIIVSNTAAGLTSTFTNKGTLNFRGTNVNPIWMNNATAATSTTNFINEGTIDINGAFSHASVDGGGIYMVGGANSFGNHFTNSKTIDFNTAAGGTATDPLFFCSTTPTNTITNSGGAAGVITVGTNGAPAKAFRLGDAETTVNNTGTITVGAGTIEGVPAAPAATPPIAGNAVFNNNAGGTLNLNSVNSPHTNNAVLQLNNTGGTLNLTTNQRIGRLAYNTGTVSVANGTTFTVYGLTLTSGKITLGTGNIVIENGGSIDGATSSNYIVTSGTGTLKQTVASGVGKIFPIGQSATSYDPVTINHTGGTPDFSARVGSQTTTIPSGNNGLVVNSEWDIVLTGTAGTTTNLEFVSAATNKDGTSSSRPTSSVGSVGHYNGTNWDKISSAYDHTLNKWTLTGYTGTFSPFIVGAPEVVLSAELLSFKGKGQGTSNILTWETASETNNKGFDVQRQTATGAWASLGFVNGAGKASTYTFEDDTPLSISYYRLRQVDFDGKEAFSKILSVSQNTKGRISITPNPTSDKVNIQLNQNDVLDSKTTLVLFDITGKQVLSQTTTAENFQLDMSNLPKGMYMLTVQSNNAVYQEKIIRQ